jgi:hypothetical protein
MKEYISVSKVVGFPNKPYLIQWASKLTQQDYHELISNKRDEVVTQIEKEAMLPSLLELLDSLPVNLKTANDVTSRSKAIGILFHEAIEQTIKSNDLKELNDVFNKGQRDVANAARIAYQNWFEWWAGFACNGITDPAWVVSTEVDLKDEDLKVQGRCDMVAGCELVGAPEALVLVDFKSSGDVYLGDILEIAAYWAMLAKTEKAASVNKAYIVRCSKEEAVAPTVIEILREDAIKAWSVFVAIAQAVKKYDEFDEIYGQKIMPKKARK